MKRRMVAVSAMLALYSLSPSSGLAKVSTSIQMPKQKVPGTCLIASDDDKLLSVIGALGWDPAKDVPKIDWKTNKAVVIGTNSQALPGTQHIEVIGTKVDAGAVTVTYVWVADFPTTVSYTKPGAKEQAYAAIIVLSAPSKNPNLKVSCQMQAPRTEPNPGTFSASGTIITDQPHNEKCTMGNDCPA